MHAGDSEQSFKRSGHAKKPVSQNMVVKNPPPINKIKRYIIDESGFIVTAGMLGRNGGSREMAEPSSEELQDYPMNTPIHF